MNQETPLQGISRPRSSRYLTWLVWGSLIFAGLVLWLSGEAGSMLRAISDADRRLLAGLLLVGLCLPIVHARRWQMMTASVGHDISLRPAVELTVTSTLINYASPGGYVWAPAKGLMARQLFGIGFSRSLPTLAAEQGLDAVALVIGSSAGLFLAGPTVYRQLLDRIESPSWEMIAIALVIVGLIVVVTLIVGRKFARRFAQSVAASGRMLATDRRRRPIILGLTLTRWVLDVAAIWLALVALGLRPSASEAVLLANLPLLVGMLSPLPGGVGFREGAMVGVASALALPASIVLGAAVVHRVILVLALPLVLGVLRFGSRIVPGHYR